MSQRTAEENRLANLAAQARYRDRLRQEKIAAGTYRPHNANLTHCSKCDLPYDEKNTAYAADGSRRCRNCHNNAVKAAYAANPEAGREYGRKMGARHADARNQARRDKRAADPEAQRELDRAIYASSSHKRDVIKYNRQGLTEAEWLVMFEAQDGGCYLCGTDLGMNTKHIHLDHDHRCCPPTRSCARCRRGLACNKCNLIAGFAKDDPGLLRFIADNLEMAVAVVTERLEEGALRSRT